MSIILENKVISKLILSKNVNNKNVLINSYSTMKKKSERFRKIWRRNSNFGTFWHLTITQICKIQWFHLTTVDF